jgi:hypothetical protein
MIVNLLSNGKFDYFPKQVYMDIFRLEHLIKLSICDDSVRDDVITECLDDVIDFEKTGVIKTSADLSIFDRVYLMLMQRIELQGTEMEMIVKCGNCGARNTVILDFTKVKEIFVKNVYNVDYVNLVVPSYSRVRYINKVFNSFIEGLSDSDKEKYLDEDGSLKTAYLIYRNFLYYMKDYDEYLDRLDIVFEKLGSMSGKFINDFRKFTESCLGRLEYNETYKCISCGNVRKVEYDFGDVNFF